MPTLRRVIANSQMTTRRIKPSKLKHGSDADQDAGGEGKSFKGDE